MDGGLNSLLFAQGLAVLGMGWACWAYTEMENPPQGRLRWLIASLILGMGLILDSGVLPAEGPLSRLGFILLCLGMSLQIHVLPSLWRSSIKNTIPVLALLFALCVTFLDGYEPFLAGTVSTGLMLTLFGLQAYVIWQFERGLQPRWISLTPLLLLASCFMFSVRMTLMTLFREEPFHSVPHWVLLWEDLLAGVAGAAVICASMSFLFVSLTRQKQHLQQVADLDGLTQIANRRALDLQLAHYAGTDLANHPLSVVMIDIDHFKSVNDRFGHAAGDQVLCALSGMIRSRIRDSDFFARFGGEEFCLLMPKASAAQAMEVLNRLRSGFNGLHPLAEHVDFQASFSAGLAYWDSSSMSSAAVLELADQRLYQAKQGGRNQIVGPD